MVHFLTGILYDYRLTFRSGLPCAPRFSGNRNEWVILSGQQTTDRVPVRKFDEHLGLELLADIRPTISVFLLLAMGF